MTNFEHYKEEINNIFDKDTTCDSLDILKEIIDKFKIAKEIDIVTNPYVYMFYKWGMSEYVEPYKLTKIEKFILENMSKDLTVIWKNGYTNVINADGQSYDYSFMVNKAFPQVKFDCLEWDKKYKIADILANCEVIDE